MERPATIQRYSRDRLAWRRTAGRMLLVALAGYAVVGLFVLSYGIVRWGWPNQTEASPAIIAALVAAPVALALLWDRLGGFKAFGFEVTLTTPSPQKIEVADVVGVFAGDPNVMTPDDLQAIQEVVQATIQAGQELLELNLRDGNYWWSTRLFLLAALAEDYSQVQQLVFVEREAERIFVGMASPGDVRQALAKRWPTLELSYQEIKTQPRPESDASEPSGIILGWEAATFKSEGNQAAYERDLRVKVNARLLREWLSEKGRPLTTDSLVWQGMTDPYLVRSLLFQFDSPYIALLRRGRLDRVVNRLDLALQVAFQAFG